MLSLNKNQQRIPLGGHQFYEDGNTLKGETFDEVVQLLTDFRLTNGRPIGNPSMDILLFYAKTSPWMVRDDLSDKKPEPPDENYVRWRSWVMGMWKSPPTKLLTSKEASYRWDKCKVCPMNKTKDWVETAESQEMNKRIFLIRQGVEVPSALGFCACHGFDTGVASFLESAEKVSNKNKADVQPKECWL